MRAPFSSISSSIRLSFWLLSVLRSRLCFMTSWTLVRSLEWRGVRNPQVRLNVRCFAKYTRLTHRPDDIRVPYFKSLLQCKKIRFRMMPRTRKLYGGYPSFFSCSSVRVALCSVSISSWSLCKRCSLCWSWLICPSVQDRENSFLRVTILLDQILISGWHADTKVSPFASFVAFTFLWEEGDALSQLSF